MSSPQPYKVKRPCFALFVACALMALITPAGAYRHDAASAKKEAAPQLDTCGSQRLQPRAPGSSNSYIKSSALNSVGAMNPRGMLSRVSQEKTGDGANAPASAPQVGRAVAFRETAPVGSFSLARVERDEQSAAADGERAAGDRTTGTDLSIRTTTATDGDFDAALESIASASVVIPGPELTFEGNSSLDTFAAFGFKVIPPDHTGDVGPNHYVQGTNFLIRIFNKAGNPLTAPFKISDLFAGLGPPCDDENDGYPQVLYDTLADRWIVSDFCTALTPGNRMSQRIAVSTTSDPTGTYFAYIFVMPNTNFNDYPIFGVWPDAYYMAADQFTQGGVPPFLGAGAFAFDRSKLLVGDPTASFLYFDLPTTTSGMMPTDVDGYVAPPANTPNLFIQFNADEFGGQDELNIFEFRPNFANPGASTFTALPDLPLATFDARQPGNNADVEQPAPATPAQAVNSIADRLMPRVVYRNLGTNASAVNSYVLNFTVNVSGVNPITAATYQAGIRWTELRRNPGTGAMTVNDQGTFAPEAGDGANGPNRWMGSIAQDNQGNIALGFSISSLTIFPSINWAGRLTTDPPGSLGQGEATMFAGTGVQAGGNNRWGSYSSMTVDPTDDCTFWYTNQYRLAANNAAPFDWNTRIGKFKYPTCTPAPKGTFSGTVTNCETGLPLQNAVVETTSPAGFNRKTDAAGNYSVTAAPGTYNVGVSHSTSGFSTATGMVTVTNGGNAVFNACIAPAPVIESAGATIVTESCGPANGAIDPGELVTVSFCVQNTGSENTSNLVGTLQATGGVTNQSGPQSYGVLVAGGAPVCRNFTFRADGAASCGGLLTATLQFQDGAENLGTVAYHFTLGTLVVAFAQNFDGVVAPALPAGWVATEAQDVANNSNPWATNTTTPDTAPNSVFTNDPNNLSDELLDSPVIAITSSSAQLTFRNNFNLETGFDGGVLEIAIGAGSFTDILTAGGSFASGGYTHTISLSEGSAIAGRMAWSGNSSGYITTTVNLPAAAAGQNIRLRWRRVTDQSVSGTGWRIDTVSITDGFDCCNTPNANLAVVKTDTPDPVNAGNQITYTITLTNNGPNDASNVELTDTIPAGTTFVSFTQTSGPAFAQMIPLVGGTGTVTATIANFANGATATFRLVVQVSPSTPDGSTITNTAEVTSTTDDFSPANNSSVATTAVIVPPPPPLTFFVAVDANNNLLRFNSLAPSIITSTTPIVGLLAGENIVGIDVRPSNGLIYGLGIRDLGATDEARLYQLDITTGVATLISPAPISLSPSGNFEYGFDFNPVPDRIRVVNAADENARINPFNGVRADAPVNDTDLNNPAGPEAIIGSAYDRNDTDAATLTTLFGIDRANSTLARQGDVNGTPASPNGGIITSIGPLGITLDSASDSGFDIVTSGGTDTAFAALRPSGGSVGLYTINLTTGQAAFVGVIDGGTPNIRGLTTLPAPTLSINDVTVVEGNGGSVNAMFTVTLTSPSDQTVMVDFVTSNGTATEPSDYTAVNGTLFFNPGQTTKTIIVPVNGDTFAEGDETFFVNLSNPNNATITDAQGLGTITNDDAAGGNVQFSSANFTVSESGASLLITVNRTGDTSGTATVDFSTTDNSDPDALVNCSAITGTALSRCDFSTAAGTLEFAPGETSKTFTVLITQDSYVEGNETFTISLTNPGGGAILGAISTTTVQITDDAVEPATNAIDDTSNFVRQHYHDFLNRQPDAAGFNFWTDNINLCNDPARRPAGQTVAQCFDKQRESTSSAFFLSPEFQFTGGFVYQFYRGSLTGTPNYDASGTGRYPLYLEFIRDARQVSEGIIVGGQISAAVLEANRARFAEEFTERPEFLAIYGALNNTQYVDKLFEMTGIAPTPSERQALIDGLINMTETRGTVLRKIVDGTVVISEGNVQFTTRYGRLFLEQEFRRKFVLMEYFGYLRRNPDQAGFVFWLGKLNDFNGDFFKAEMVRAFIISPEYRQRFGP